MPNITIDEDSCALCEACVDICYARDVFVMQESKPIVVRPEECRLCGHCIAVCPTDAIDHDRIPLEDCPVIDPGHLPSVDQVVAVLRARRSFRRFEDRSVPREVIRELISYSRWIPTGENRQFIDWIVLDDRRRITELLQTVLQELRDSTERGRSPSRFLGGLSVEEVDVLIQQGVQNKKRFFFDAPVVLAAYCDKDAFCAREEATYAAYNVVLTAERLGLGTCHIGSVQLLLEEFSHVQHDMLGVPQGKELQVLLVLGYPLWRFHRMLPRRMPTIKWNPRPRIARPQLG